MVWYTPRPPFDSPLFAAGIFSVKQAVWFKYVSVKKKSLVCVEAKVCFLHVRLSWSVLRVIGVFKLRPIWASYFKDLTRWIVAVLVIVPVTSCYFQHPDVTFCVSFTCVIRTWSLDLRQNFVWNVTKFGMKSQSKQKLEPSVKPRDLVFGMRVFEVVSDALSSSTCHHPLYEPSSTYWTPMSTTQTCSTPLWSVTVCPSSIVNLIETGFMYLL